MFDKSTNLFPIKNNYIYLSHCGISPLYSEACRRETEMAQAQRDSGGLVFKRDENLLEDLRTAAARLFKTSRENLAFVKNTTEGMGLVANGYPFRKGDQIISYVHEYPANHYPWKLQELRGVELVLLPNRGHGGRSDSLACRWSMADLEAATTSRTRIIALSHVQFTSGFAADLKVLGEFCRQRGIDLVIDAAQSLGCLPVYPEECNIAAVAASGWKWLLGPVGTGLLYTSEEFRAKLGYVLVGADAMIQGSNYLDHTWQPHRTARRFEYSTSPVTLAAALQACIEGTSLRYGLESIQAEVFRLQDIILAHLDRDRYSPVEFPAEHRSGILAVICRDDPLAVMRAMEEKEVICTSRGGYLRLAPHFCTTDDEVLRAVDLLNSL